MFRTTLAFLALTATATAKPTQPPVAPRHPHTTTLHGQELNDDYYWLRDRDDPAVRRYLEAENAYTEAMLEPSAGFRQALYDEMLARIKSRVRSELLPFAATPRTTRPNDLCAAGQSFLANADLRPSAVGPPPKEQACVLPPR